MGKLTKEGLVNIREKIHREDPLAAGNKRVKITVHKGTCGIAAGAQKVHHTIVEEISKHHTNDVLVTTSGCMGICCREPLITVEERDKDTIVYEYLDPNKMEQIFRDHIMGGLVQKDFVMARGREKDTTVEAIHERDIPHLKETPFFSKQKTIALRNRGLINAEEIDEYIARDGYFAAAKALVEMTPDQVIGEVKKSGLRGRGGAGFPTGLKWTFANKSKGDIKYILCNADEGDPGAFMDRSVLEGDPHAVLEGMIIGGYAIGASQGYIYCRAEYPLAIRMLTRALEQARGYGLLGNDILGSGYNLDIEIYQGAGAFVCGEETALMASIEGRRGMPRPRPPFPANQGLWDRPSVLNNVETYACVPQIILEGGKWFASIGTENSKGTKVFALTGDVNNVGLVEVPMGTTVRDIIFEIGGGIPGGKEIKAAQLGGPSGGCIPESTLDTPIDYEEITKLGAIMGSGGMVIMNEDNCMVDSARFFMEFCQEESCGKCTPCREGTKRMLEILERICSGEGKDGDIALLEEMAIYVKDNSLCGLGQTAPNPVLTTLKYFRDEFEAHITDKICPAGICKRITPAPCQNACPVGIDVPSYVALIALGRFQESLDLIRKDNPFPAVCGRVCTHPCEYDCKRGEIDKPISIKSLKRFVADYEKNLGRKPVQPVEITQKEKVAIIGAGPAGLTCAHDLIERGYAVTVFESLPVAGGLLTMGIPDYRLPREEVEAEIQDIQRMGVDIKTNTVVGKDVLFDDLRKDYEAIFIGVGAWKSLNLGIEGEGEFEGFLDCLGFLKDVNLEQRKKPGEKVVIIGGGNAAIDAARTSVRLGVREVHIAYRRSREEMPASKEEIEEAEHEGIQINYLTAPLRVLGEGGKVTGLECIRTELGEPDVTGRRRPIPVHGSEFVIRADVIIPAIGQEPDHSFLDKQSGIRVSKWNFIEVDPNTLQTNMPGVFAGGDAVTGPASVIEAIAAGQKAAVVMDNYLRSHELTGGQKIPRPKMLVDTVELSEDIEAFERPEMPTIGVEERKKSFKEAEAGFEARIAVLEAKRCLRCDF